MMDGYSQAFPGIRVAGPGVSLARRFALS